MQKKHDRYYYLGIETHGILGAFVEFRVFQHVLFSAGALKNSQSQGRQSSEDLMEKNKTFKSLALIIISDLVRLINVTSPLLTNKANINNQFM